MNWDIVTDQHVSDIAALLVLGNIALLISGIFAAIVQRISQNAFNTQQTTWFAGFAITAHIASFACIIVSFAYVHTFSTLGGALLDIAFLALFISPITLIAAVVWMLVLQKAKTSIEAKNSSGQDGFIAKGK
jgi:hypothetical protein